MIKSGGVVARHALGWAVGAYALMFALVAGVFLAEVTRTRPAAHAVAVGLVALAVTGAAQMVWWRGLWAGRRSARSPWPMLAVQAVVALVPLSVLPEEWLYVPGLLVASGLLVLHAPLNWWVAGGAAAGLAALVAISPVDNRLGAQRMLLVLAAGLLVHGLVWFATALARIDAEHRYDMDLAVLRERERMAHDLHDLLSVRLSEVSVRGEVALRRIAEGDVDGARAEVDTVLAAARAAQEEMRASVRGRWSLSYRDELRAVEGLLRADGIRTRVTGRLHALPAEVERALALTLREGAANVLRHSPACRNVTVRQAADTASVRLELVNDRAGNGGGKVPGSGVDSLRARAVALGGGLTAVRDAEAGTYVLVVIIPLPDGTHPWGALTGSS
ncbi:histidine kinase [Streptomyces sp. HUAS MG91]|uniref:Histidine kinase n=1 Tax=Streptomyces tabacisoli TaxID=3156398 RepID=A0AAU8IZ54_9ACTN